MSTQLKTRVALPAALCAAGITLAVFLLVSNSDAADEDKKPPMLASSIVSWEDARPIKGDWGEMRRYFEGQTRGTRDVLVAIAVVEPGKAVHDSHRHAEEEYLLVNEGTGIWYLAGKPTPARKNDILYVEPWVDHGLVNTGDKPLVFTVIRYNAKGVKPPPEPKPSSQPEKQ